MNIWRHRVFGFIPSISPVFPWKWSILAALDKSLNGRARFGTNFSVRDVWKILALIRSMDKFVSQGLQDLPFKYGCFIAMIKWAWNSSLDLNTFYFKTGPKYGLLSFLSQLLTHSLRSTTLVRTLKTGKLDLNTFNRLMLVRSLVGWLRCWKLSKRSVKGCTPISYLFFK